MGPRGAGNLWVIRDGFDHMVGSCHNVKGLNWNGPLRIGWNVSFSLKVLTKTDVCVCVYTFTHYWVGMCLNLSCAIIRLSFCLHEKLCKSRCAMGGGELSDYLLSINYLNLHCWTSFSLFWQWELVHKHCWHAYVALFFIHSMMKPKTRHTS